MKKILIMIAQLLYLIAGLVFLWLSDYKNEEIRFFDLGIAAFIGLLLFEALLNDRT